MQEFKAPSLFDTAAQYCPEIARHREYIGTGPQSKFPPRVAYPSAIAVVPRESAMWDQIEGWKSSGLFNSACDLEIRHGAK